MKRVQDKLKLSKLRLAEIASTTPTLSVLRNCKDAINAFRVVMGSRGARAALMQALMQTDIVARKQMLNDFYNSNVEETRIKLVAQHLFFPVSAPLDETAAEVQETLEGVKLVVGLTYQSCREGACSCHVPRV